MRQITVSVFILVLLLHASALKAENFIVTSRADRGAGSLWEAIERANANGTADRDYIRFNLPGTTVDDRTIILDKLELPALTSNIEIDGTTQPGTPFGISNAKVRILKTSLVGAGYFHMLKIYFAEDVAIYGLFLDFRIPETGAYGISLFNSSNITIGATGKGNVLNAAGGSVGSDVVSPGKSENIHISYNIIGMEPDGITVAGLGAQARINLRSSGDVEIDHNQISAETIMEEFPASVPNPSSRIYHVHDNLFGTDRTGTLAVGVSRMLITSPDPMGGPAARIHVLNNHFVSGYLELQCFGGEIKVQGNKVNTDITGTIHTGTTASPAVTVWNNGGTTLIGGDLPAEKNYIAGGPYGVYVADVHNATIKKNSIFCTLTRGIQSIETTFLETLSATTVTGRSEPNATIEIYEADHCDARSECTGKVFIGSTTANGAGQWSFSGTLPPDVVATGTNSAGRTSEFTRATIDLQQLDIVPPLCGTPGSIKGIRVTGAISMQWEDGAGNLIAANTPELLNVPPGTYKLFASASNDPHSDCSPQEFSINMINTQPDIITTAVTVVSPCGNNTGSIRNVIVTGGYKNTYEWRNDRNEIVGTDVELLNVPSGSYRLTAYSSPTCFDVSDPVVITDQPGPVIDITNMTVTPSTCMNNNGSIRNIQLGGMGTLAIRWLNEQDTHIGSSENIGNLAPGTYRLEVTDQSSCPALVSAPIVIGALGQVTIDVSQMKSQPAGCNNQPGAITGIQVTGAETYTWRNGNNDIVGNTPDLTGVPAGAYMLTATNRYNCTAQTLWIEVENMQASNWSVKGEIHLPVCNESNGEIRITDISGTQVQSLRWTNAATNATLGTDRTLGGLGPGDYKLYLTDPDGCELEVYTANIPQRTPPVLTGTPQITNEFCARANGSITLPGVNGAGPFLLQWTDAAGALMSTEQQAKNLKAGSYYVEVMDMYGCTVKSDAYIVQNEAEPLAPPADQTITIGKGLPLRINVTSPSPAVFTLYADAGTTMPLQDNTTGIFDMPPLQQNTTYYVTLTEDICKSPPAKIDVKTVDKVTVGVPTAFTPNGDGLNDIFRPQYSMMTSLESFTVFSRWGNEVFTTKTMGVGWNGRLNGAEQPTGSYIYIIRGKDVMGNPFQLQGSVLLIR
ncbi:gliding motility-associated C-terminal domain-containing protein [Chitinophaga sp. GCM10012297]|uniref:Gliding motility-associated C-terminal domain-containing protein n=1 Tax=Chitinophaga chungangae TaxID=2821488 RepID=A0ABS3YKS7_9BACT|nr:gliding motility-associated C-terminal domain-containing protein [Chitinophaga chungangae]MBO9155257.1 gliding motility-associated C-terminal domain-containing protein [Chitinophaga chungangae]